MRLAAALASLLLSVWCIFLDDVINHDGILYIHTADLIGRGEWQAAIASYKWLFYPLLIATLDKLTGIGLELSAHVLNVGFTVLTVVTFISLIRELGGSRSAVAAAAVLILLFPGLNEYRSFVMRDAGFLAFYMLALLLFMKLLKTPSWRLTVGWALAMVVATLFRIEGVAFLLTLGIFQHLKGLTARPRRIMALVYGAITLACLVLVLAWWLSPLSSPRPGAGLQAIIDPLQALWQNVLVNFSTKATDITTTIWSEQLADYAHIMLIPTAALIIALRTLDTLTPLYALLTGHALYRQLVFPLTEARTVWVWLVIMHLLALSATTLVRLILPGRLPVALSLTLILAAPFSMVMLYQQWLDRRERGVRRNWVFPALCAVVLLTGVEGLYSPTGKSHLKQAGLWLKGNTAPETNVASDSAIVLFYAARRRDLTKLLERSQVLELLRAGNCSKYDYLALRIKLRSELQPIESYDSLGEPLVSFTSGSKDSVRIYDLCHLGESLSTRSGS